VFGGAIPSAGCRKRSLVRLGGDIDANHARILAVLTCNPRSQTGAGTKHGDIAGEHVADQFLDARSPSHRSQVLDKQRADTVALPSIIDQKRDLSLRAAQDLI
jgi:hypothetical protein